MRDGLRRGLTIEAGGVDNPYKLGFIGSSDTHLAAGVFREDDYTGPSGVAEAQRRGSVPVVPTGAAETVRGVERRQRSHIFDHEANVEWRLGAGRGLGRGEHA